MDGSIDQHGYAVRAVAGRGQGAQLVAAAEAWAMRRGVARIVVRSNVAREAAHGFYPALGYRLLKTQHVYAKTID